ncbi:MAG: hypothetical protein RL441_146, partial [Actinomycetota bacterium]
MVKPQIFEPMVSSETAAIDKGASAAKAPLYSVVSP